jgi:AraC-like DNA-binding protein
MRPGTQSRKYAEVPVDVETLRRLYESGAPALAFAFSRRKTEDWAPPHSHARGQLFALNSGLVVIEAGNERWMFPSHRCAWIPPNCLHAARSVGRASGSMVYLSAAACRGLPRRPCLFNSSDLLFAVVQRLRASKPSQLLSQEQKRLVSVLRDELRHPDEQPLRLPLPRAQRLARVAQTFLEDVSDRRTLDAWADLAGMSRRTFMRAFSSDAGLPFGRWRQQARLFAALEMFAEGSSVTDTAIAVGYDSVSAFIDMFRTMLGATPLSYLKSSRA